jgi:aspartyl-tRNA(Asn)/glutamyl-tRNA(Gln) amidotransferase subunit B
VVEHAEGDKESIKLAVNYLTSDLLGLENSEKEGSLEQVDPKNFLALVSMARNGEISSRGAKDILGAMYTAGGNPKKLAEDLDLFQKSSKEELEKVAREVIRSNEKVVQDYREGKETALQYLVGQGMKITKGSANPAVFKELLKHLLKS